MTCFVVLRTTRGKDRSAGFRCGGLTRRADLNHALIKQKSSLTLIFESKSIVVIDYGRRRDGHVGDALDSFCPAEDFRVHDLRKSDGMEPVKEEEKMLPVTGKTR